MMRLRHSGKPVLDEALLDAVAARARRKLRARRQRDGVWLGLGTFGLIGWSVAVPMLVGLAFGVAIDQRASGRHSWTLMLLMVGLALGCFNAWLWIERQRRAIRSERQDDPALPNDLEDGS